MPFIKRLCRDFTGVVDSHQARRVRLLSRIEIRFLDQTGRIVTRRTPGRRCYCTQGVVGTDDEAVDRRKVTICHNRIIAKRRRKAVYSTAFFVSNPWSPQERHA